MYPELPATRLAAWLAGAAEEDVTLERWGALGGHGSHRAWWVDLIRAGTPLAAVVQATGTGLGSGSHRHALLQSVQAAGVPVPTPLWACDDASVLGHPFHVMTRVTGTAADRTTLTPTLARDLGTALARLHTLTPENTHMPFLARPEPDPVTATIADLRHWFDARRAVRPVLEWGLRWLERQVPVHQPLALCHRDCHPGNLLVGEDHLAAVLHWAHAGWDTPQAEVGRVRACCHVAMADSDQGDEPLWTAFQAAYTAAGGTPVETTALPYWEVLAHTRWAVMALERAARVGDSPGERLGNTLDAHRVPQAEYRILTLIQHEETR